MIASKFEMSIDSANVQSEKVGPLTVEVEYRLQTGSQSGARFSRILQAHWAYPVGASRSAVEQTSASISAKTSSSKGTQTENSPNSSDLASRQHLRVIILTFSHIDASISQNVTKFYHKPFILETNLKRKNVISISIYQ